MKIGIFGGAFNPIHYGHLRTAEEVADMLCLKKVLFIPSGQPAFKKPGLAEARHRYQMIKIAIDDNPLFAISDIELKTPGVSYSVDTVKNIKEHNKDYDLYFIMGVDAFADLPDWKEPESLITMSNIVVISRPGYPFGDLSSSPYMKRVSKIVLKELDNGTRKKYSVKLSAGKRCHLLHVTELNISASRIRNNLMYGKNSKYLLPDLVKSYIISNKLYKMNRES